MSEAEDGWKAEILQRTCLICGKPLPEKGETMAEYIEREAAIDALQNHYEVRNAVQNGIMDECVMLMMRVPAADVVEVVRCKECANKFDWPWCGMFQDGGYCSAGVRKDGDGE